MIYGISGTYSSAYGIDFAKVYYAEDVYGKSYIVESPLENFSLMYEDYFSELNSDYWNVRTGDYKQTWLPSDYSSNIVCDEDGITLKSIKDYPMEGYEWSSAYISTESKIYFNKGAIEFKGKFPNTDYYHSTVWLYSQTNPLEIDICETDSNGSGANIYYYNQNFTISKHNSMHKYAIPTYNEHTYLLTIDNDYVRLFCDNKFLTKFKIANAQIDDFNSFENAELFVIINILPFTSLASHNASTTSPVEMNVEYIKVYA